MSYRDEDDPFEEDIVFDQAGLLSTSRKSSKSAIRRVSSGKCAMFSKTLGLCGAFLGLGLTFAIPGPLSPVPPGELSHDKSLMTYEVMYRCQGFMIGAMFGARLLDRFNRLFLVFLALLVTALLVTIIPWCGNVWLLRTDMFLLGVSLGFLSTGGNVLCLDLWGRNSGPFMQALHFSFSLGVFLAPFLSQPLMTPVNYALVSPTTTPASMFPLHRLPRDVGSISSNATSFVAADASLLHASSPPYHDSAFNKSATNASYSLSTSVPFSTPATKTSVPELNGMLLMAPASSSALNFSESKVTASSIAATSMTFAARPHIEAVNSSSSLGQPSNASTESPGSIPVPAVASVAASPPKVDVSTTTHRSPRPKPVLTNSEKLKDNKWENEKFRKPPPEDLVPVSTTMKPMVKVGNKTTVASNMTYSSTPSLLSIGSYSTVKPSVLTNSMKPANVSKLSLILNGSTGPNSTVISSPAPSKTPLIDASSTLSSISKISPAGSIPLKINASLVSNTSEAVSSSVHMKINETHHITDTGIVPVSPWTPDKAPIQGLQVKGNAANHSTPAPITLEAILSTSSSAAKQGDALLSTHSVVSKVLKDTPSLSTGKSTINNKSGSSPRSGFSDSLSSASSAGKEKLSSSQSSAEVSLPVIVNPKSVNNSHYMGKSISLDEQDSAQSGLSSSTSQQPPAWMSTHQPQKISKLGEHEKTSSVNQKSFGGGHVKAMMEAKPVQVTTESTGLPSSKDFKVPEGKTKVIPTSSPFLVKNIPAVVETINHPESPAGPKHVHHSKPASTVVNDTAEVTHTVIDDVANRLEKYGLSRMELMYLTVGMILLATSFLFLGFLCFNPRDPKSKTEEEDMNGHVGRAGQRGRLGSGQSAVVPSRCLRHTLIGLMMVLLMITSGVQAMYGQLLMVYALQAPLQLSQSTGTALTATFWGALTSTRFACILLASALSPTAMLVLSVAICSCATWLLSAFASSSEVALWIGSVMVSVGTASVIPSGMLWMQRHVLVTHRVAAMLVMGPAMGEMFFPTLAYKMMVSLGPASLVHLPALLSLFAIAVWAAEWRLARYPRQPLCSHGDESSGYQLANQHDEDDLLDLTMSPIVNGTTAVLRSHSRSNGNGLGVHRMSA